MNTLHIQQLSLSYGAQHIVHQLDLHLEPGQIGCLLGPSGCGKTTVLRGIAGFEVPTQGQILIGGQVVASSSHWVPPEARSVGMVFQDYALFPHLTIADNIAFGLRKASRLEKKSRVAQMLDLVGLDNLAKRYPHELSGGQQQRVALARALAPSPKLLLLDEPFSNLDIALRERLSLEVRAMMKKLGTTVMMVTHDQHEAFAMADMVGVLMDGKLQQWASPYDIYHEPSNRAVADFIGEGSFLEATVSSNHCIEIELGQLCQIKALDIPENTSVDMLIRPDDILHDDASPVRAKVIDKVFRGAEFLYTLALPSGQILYSLIPSHHDHAMGELIGIRLEIDHLITFHKGN